jgi:hypothetical protein
MSEDKVCRNDMCWCVGAFLRSYKAVRCRRAVTNGIRADYHSFTGACDCSCTSMVCMAGVSPEWSHNMAHALELGPRTLPREDVTGLGLIDKDIDLLRGVYVTFWSKA